MELVSQVEGTHSQDKRVEAYQLPGAMTERKPALGETPSKVVRFRIASLPRPGLCAGYLTQKG
jgi:hypothetical protein